VLTALDRHPAQLLHATGQAVAHPLQLSEREQAWAGARIPVSACSAPDRNVEGEGPVGRYVGKRIGDDLRQLALHSRDLRTQFAPRSLLCGWSFAIGDSWLLELGDHTRLLP
jgi:hypothetical protein